MTVLVLQEVVERDSLAERLATTDTDDVVLLHQSFTPEKVGKKA
jgi:hypothetical protein